MSHELFRVRDTSEETLSLIPLGGGASARVLLALPGFLIWGDRLRGLGKPRARGSRASAGP